MPNYTTSLGDLWLFPLEFNNIEDEISSLRYYSPEISGEKLKYLIHKVKGVFTNTIYNLAER